MFQDFSAPKDKISGDSRLSALREEMNKLQLDAIIVPHADEQRNEYLPPCNERLAWISGFTGSAGAAIVTRDTAILFVDGRYTLQAAEQTDGTYWQTASLIETPPPQWLTENAQKNWQIGIDPWLHTKNEVSNLEQACENFSGSLVLIDNNLVDEVWRDRPPMPKEPVRIHPIQFAGKTTREKLQTIQGSLDEKKADSTLLTDASSVSWLFNIRGSDVVHTPLTLAHAWVPREGEPVIFIDSDKLDMEVRAFLTQVADLKAPDEMVDFIARNSPDRSVLLDPNLTPHAIANLIKGAEGKIVWAQDPVALPRAVKNETEISGSRDAHVRDGAAMATFLCWLDQQNPSDLSEISVAQKLESTRREKAGNHPLQDISFDTISGSGPNGAIVHYRVTEATDRTFRLGELYLVDSGGQYEDGTTDITRTVALGQPTAEQIRAFTLVLKGHIAIAAARFPKGTRGVDIDILARHALWQAGFDYAHGTGHGVGSYLSVHEGPQNISRRGMQEFQPGMIVSNEPGYYKTGEFGIRIENLVLVEEASAIDGGEIDMMSFENLTLTPMDTRLVNVALLSSEERNWLNDYHRRVEETLTPLVDTEVASWLREVCKPV